VFLSEKSGLSEKIYNQMLGCLVMRKDNRPAQKIFLAQSRSQTSQEAMLFQNRSLPGFFFFCANR
jgi:hypothetical protein